MKLLARYIAIAACFGLFAVGAQAKDKTGNSAETNSVDLLIKFNPHIEAQGLHALSNLSEVQTDPVDIPNWVRIQTEGESNLAKVLAAPGIEYVQPNYELGLFQTCIFNRSIFFLCNEVPAQGGFKFHRFRFSSLNEF